MRNLLIWLPTLAILLALRLFDVAPVNQLRHAWFDITSAVFAPDLPTPAPVVIVAIDDASLDRVGRWPWPRDRIADLVDRISAANPSVIALNFLLSDGASNPISDGDLRLQAALAGAPTVLGSAILNDIEPNASQTEPETGGAQAALPQAGRLLSSLPEFRVAAQGEGFISAFEDVDGRLRKSPVAIAIGDALIPSFAVEAARVHTGNPVLEIEPGLFGAPAALNLSNRELPLDWRGRLIPDLRRLGVAETLSAASVLDGSENPARFTDTVVIVGATATGLGGQWRVPGHGYLSGVAAQSLFVQSAMTGEALSRPISIIMIEIVLGSALFAAMAMLGKGGDGHQLLTRFFVCFVPLIGGGLILILNSQIAADVTWPTFCLVAGFGLASADRFVLLRRESHRLREFNTQLIDQAADIILTLDDDDRITFANHSAMALIGLDHAEAAGQSIHNFLTIRSPTAPVEAELGIGKADVFEASTKVPPAARMADFELHRSRLVDAEPSTRLLIGRDITRLRSVERRLDLTSERMQAILDIVPIGVALFSSDRRLANSNVAFRTLLGLESLSGNPTYDALFEGWHAEAKENGGQAGITGPSNQDSKPFENPNPVARIRNDDGRWLCLHQAIPRVGGLLIAAYDETDSRNQALALNEEMKRATAADAAKGVLLANVSHELRTPLNAIIGFSEIMKQDLSSVRPKQYADYIGHVHDSALYLLSLVNDLLEESGNERQDKTDGKQEADVVAEMRSAVAALQTMADKAGVTLTATLPNGPLPVRVGGRHLRQIVSNLLTNGIKFTASGGAVTLDVGVTDQRAIA
ncbi:MAG: CHASE2 domain-containing protein, partial [Pseudomonadota bacterium]